MKPVVETDKISKVYQISHESKAKYGSLREDLGKLVSKTVKKSQVEVPQHEDFWALKDVSFEINEGDIFGIVGRNGSGKSTLLKILSKITEPTSGQAILRGRVSSLLEVGTGFHPELTGRENVFLNGAVLGMSRREIRGKFDEIVAFAEIEKFIDTPVKFYSSGMYTRLAFAVAAHLEPDILIVDEVLAVGDLGFQKKSLGKMEEIGKSGRTILFVSHNLSAVQSLCKKGIFLVNGQVNYKGPIEQVINTYRKSLETGRGIDIKKVRGVKAASIKISNDLSPDDRLIAEFEFYTDKRLNNCFVNLHIEDLEDRLMIHCRTDQIGENPTFEPGFHKIKFLIDRIGLRSGAYNAWFRLYVESEEGSSMIDSERALFEVKGKFFGGLIDLTNHWSWEEVTPSTKQILDKYD